MLLMELNRILHRISFWRLESLYEAASLEPVLDSLSHGVESSASENVYSTAPSSKGPTVCLYNNLQSGVMPTSTTSGLATKSSRQQGFDVTILQRSASCMQETVIRERLRQNSETRNEEASCTGHFSACSRSLMGLLARCRRLFEPCRKNVVRICKSTPVHAFQALQLYVQSHENQNFLSSGTFLFRKMRGSNRKDQVQGLSLRDPAEQGLWLRIRWLLGHLDDEAHLRMHAVFSCSLQEGR